MQPDRWFGVGSAEGVDAGARAANDALRRDDAKLLMVFRSQSHDLPALLRQIRTRAGDVPLIGWTTAGEIATSGPSDASVVVTALGGSGFAVRAAAATGASRNLREAGAHVARCLPARADLPYKVLLLLTEAEIERLAGIASGTPVAGFYTYGEIARTRGVRGFHNQTLVVLAIS
jgi:hypothetical protein